MFICSQGRLNVKTLLGCLHLILFLLTENPCYRQKVTNVIVGTGYLRNYEIQTFRSNSLKYEFQNINVFVIFVCLLNDTITTKGLEQGLFPTFNNNCISSLD